MKRIVFILFLAALFQGGLAIADDNHGKDGGNGKDNKNNGHGKPSARQPRGNNRQRPSRRGSGYNNARTNSNNRGGGQYNRQANGGNYNRNNFNHGANHVSPRFQSMGIHSAPRPFTNRSQMMVTDRNHSVIHMPMSGPHGEAIHANVFARTSINGPVIRGHMAIVTGNVAFRANIGNFNRIEIAPNHYYWHSYGGFNFCHYYDPWGYHWYGWYLGSSYFWTRYYGNNWWWYDPVYFRWCYWHDGGWWWQDPANMSVMYVYNNGSYIPNTDSGANVGAPMNIQPGTNILRSYRSADGSRVVKISGSGNDAFLYDTADPPSFSPIYLASGVKGVKISNPQNGQSMQILLTLNDGSFQLFDDQGNPYNGGGGNNSGNQDPANYNAAGPPPADDSNGSLPPVPNNGGNPAPPGGGGNNGGSAPPPAAN
jgi:hypothetical protein